MIKYGCIVTVGLSLAAVACGGVPDESPGADETGQDVEGSGQSAEESDGEDVGQATAALTGADINVAVYDPYNAIWGIDYDRNGSLSPLEIQPQLAFGMADDVPLAFVPGTFPCNSTTKITRLATFRHSTKSFYVDTNNSRAWDAGDSTYTVSVAVSYPDTLGRPFVRQVYAPGSTTNCRSQVGITVNEIGVLTPTAIRWYADTNLDGTISSNELIVADNNFGEPGDYPLPIIYGTGKQSVLAVYRPSAGQWYVDANNNKLWDGCSPAVTGDDECVTQFGAPDQVGFASPFFKFLATSTGATEFIDSNANYIWNGPPTDSQQAVGSQFTLRVLGRFRTAE